MRIITGIYKGRIIKMPRGIRPTQDKVRKALFDILGDIKGLFFLELFAGSGAVGIEALSQGVREVVFVEKDRICIEKIKQNLSIIGLSGPSTALGMPFDKLRIVRRRSREPVERVRGMVSLPNHYRVIGLDALRAIRQLKQENKKFDIIFLDPPYYRELAKKALQTLASYDILAANGFVIIQHFKKDNLSVTLGVLTLFRQSKYGDTLLSFYKKLSRNHAE